MDWGILIPIFGILMGCSIPMVAIRLKTQLKMAQINAAATAEHTAEKAAQYASRVASLEDRVRVLERIVTDKGYDVATQIEALRDERRVEERSHGLSLGLNQGEKV